MNSTQATDLPVTGPLLKGIAISMLAFGVLYLVALAMQWVQPSKTGAASYFLGILLLSWAAVLVKGVSGLQRAQRSTSARW